MIRAHRCLGLSLLGLVTASANAASINIGAKSADLSLDYKTVLVHRDNGHTKTTGVDPTANTLINRSHFYINLNGEVDENTRFDIAVNSSETGTILEVGKITRKINEKLAFAFGVTYRNVAGYDAKLIDASPHDSVPILVCPMTFSLQIIFGCEKE